MWKIIRHQLCLSNCHSAADLIAVTVYLEFSEEFPSTLSDHIIVVLICSFARM